LIALDPQFTGRSPYLARLKAGEATAGEDYVLGTFTGRTKRIGEPLDRIG
jgi:hypothetical protein